MLNLTDLPDAGTEVIVTCQAKDNPFARTLRGRIGKPQHINAQGGYTLQSEYMYLPLHTKQIKNGKKQDHTEYVPVQNIVSVKPLN